MNKTGRVCVVCACVIVCVCLCACVSVSQCDIYIYSPPVIVADMFVCLPELAHSTATVSPWVHKHEQQA